MKSYLARHQPESPKGSPMTHEQPSMTELIDRLGGTKLVALTPDEFDAEVMEGLEVAEMPVLCDPVEELHDATTRLRAEQGRIEAILRKLTGSTIISPETPRV